MLKESLLGAVRRKTFICCRNVQISASSSARGRNRSTTVQPMSLKRSLITRQHRPDSRSTASQMRFPTGTGSRGRSWARPGSVNNIAASATDAARAKLIDTIFTMKPLLVCSPLADQRCDSTRGAVFGCFALTMTERLICTLGHSRPPVMSRYGFLAPPEVAGSYSATAASQGAPFRSARRFGYINCVDWPGPPVASMPAWP
jgi:hypothetical protein